MGAEHIVAIPTKAVGILGSTFTWPAVLMALLNLLVGGALVALIKKWPDLKRVAAERANSIDDGRRRDMDRMRRRIELLEQKLEAQAAAFNAELAVMRHRANNATMCLDALLMLLRAAPDKVAEHVSTITEMRDRQRLAEAAEKGAVHAAKIVAAAPTAEHGDSR